ncbi:TGF-beta receptor type-2-like isoform X1 [Clavelina lepadiformis]|uniref:TGF-beta receptor type-2-like isoform X1 n=1 Tax=Clavelina lepadiformis TaxID=159417 RepID=UPI004042CA55
MPDVTTPFADMTSFIYLSLVCVIFISVQASEFDCCRSQGVAAECNSTHCKVPCEDRDSCETGLCNLDLYLNMTSGVTSFNAYAFCQSSLQNGKQKQEDLFSSDDIKGYCSDDDQGHLFCICGYDVCNHVIKLPNVPSTPVPDQPKTNSMTPIIIGVSSAVLLILISIFLVRCCIRRQARIKDDEYDCKLTAGSRLSSDDASLVDGGLWDESGKHSFSAYKYSSSVATQYSRGSRGNSGCHSDQLLPIDLQTIIGRGRFAEVWKGKLQQDASSCQVVSVKVFRLRNYGAWRQEKDMLTESWMRHDNIIEFYASEQRTVKGRLQYWLVTAYYQQGSLAEFLRSHILGWLQFCDMAISIANGLAYLHVERDSAGRAKIPIAHRDVKSCNILVKDDCRSCVLADFGLSLKLDPELSRDELSNAGQVGTSRYMAPELLERLVNLTDIEMFKRVDVYGMALVMWEMANRCDATEGMASTYSPPFGNKINDHPTKQQMLLLVCRERQLPDIPDIWRSHKGLSIFVDEILTESWEYEAEARITARCVYERLLHLRDLDVTSDSDEAARLREKVENEVNKLANSVISTVV